MDVYAVMVHAGSGQWIDTLWTTNARAHERRTSLKLSMAATNVTHHVWVVALRLEDGVLADPPGKKASGRANDYEAAEAQLLPGIARRKAREKAEALWKKQTANVAAN